ncbi:preprotein translocase subunit YajC [Candidatus Latescibacterota bacterium]
MNFELISNAFAQGAEETRKVAPIWPMLIAIFAVFYFFIIRPQRTKQKDSKSMLNTLAKGDHVITIGGICGTVFNIKEKKGEKSDDDILVLRVSDNTKIEMIRSSIAKVVNKKTDADRNESK